MKKHRIVLSFITFFLTMNLFGQKVSIKGVEFYVNGCSRIWFNGANTPWDAWEDFGSNNFDSIFWKDELERLRNNSINCVRVWISCNGQTAPSINSSGVVSAPGTLFWKHCDILFRVAKEKKIYVLPTLMTHNHTLNNHTNYQSWRNMVNSTGNIQSYINNFLVPFAKRYENNPYLLGLDLCNEPEQLTQSAYGSFSKSAVQRLFAMCAAAVHNNTSVLVTLGTLNPKYLSNKFGEVNWWSNSAMQAAYNDPKAFLDFYEPHHYPEYEYQYHSSPFVSNTSYYGITDRPVLVGECPAEDMPEIPMSIIQAYENALANGFQGCFGWISNGVDHYGNLSTLGPATKAFKNNHPNLVYPSSSSTTATAYSNVNNTGWIQDDTVVLCQGGTVAFGPHPVTSTGWSWTGPNNFTAAVREITFNNVQPNLSGVYTATYNNGSGCPASKDYYLTVNPLPALTAVSNVNNAGWAQKDSVALCAGGTVAFGPWPHQYSTGWSWSGPNGYTSTVREIMFNNAQSNLTGTYTATFTDSKGCSASINYRLRVDVCTGINVLAESRLVSIYPNPISTIFTISVSPEQSLSNAVLKIYEVSGKEVKSISINNYETIIDKEDFKSGIYFYGIFNNPDDNQNEKIGSGKLIIEN